MKKLAFYSLLLFVTVLTISSCKKDDPAPAKTKTELLTQNTWKFNTATSTDATEQALYTAFLTGSTFSFKKDSTYTETDLLSSTPTTGKWVFADTETSIILDKGTQDATKWTAVTLDDSNFAFSYTDSSSNNTVIKITYKKK